MRVVFKFNFFNFVICINHVCNHTRHVNNKIELGVLRKKSISDSSWVCLETKYGSNLLKPHILYWKMMYDFGTGKIRHHNTKQRLRVDRMAKSVRKMLWNNENIPYDNLQTNFAILLIVRCCFVQLFGVRKSPFVHLEIRRVLELLAMSVWIRSLNVWV